MTRAFIAVRPPDPVLDAIAALPTVPGRATTRERWHVTLQFLGDVEDLDAIDLALQGLRTRAGVAQFGGLGAFPSARRATVVWLGLRQGSETLRALAGEIGTRLGIEERRAYHPHLTLARLKTPTDVTSALLGADAVGDAWVVDEAVLYESRLHPEGARYLVQGSASLA